MALISSKVLIFAHSFFLVVLNSCLLVTPASISESSLVFMLGEAMRLVGLPHRPSSYPSIRDLRYISERTIADIRLPSLHPLPSPNARRLLQSAPFFSSIKPSQTSCSFSQSPSQRSRGSTCAQQSSERSQSLGSFSSSA